MSSALGRLTVTNTLVRQRQGKGTPRKASARSRKDKTIMASPLEFRRNKQPVGHQNRAQIPDVGPEPVTPAVWWELKRGDNVSLFVVGEGKQSGLVDAVSADGSVLWLVLTGGRGRRLFLREDVHGITVTPHGLATT